VLYKEPRSWDFRGMVVAEGADLCPGKAGGLGCREIGLGNTKRKACPGLVYVGRGFVLTSALVRG